MMTGFERYTSPAEVKLSKVHSRTTEETEEQRHEAGRKLRRYLQLWIV
jgi:hypothetical protein